MENEPINELQASVAEWEQRLHALANEPRQEMISLPRKMSGRRVNREEIANAFLTSFELVGGVPRLAHWADENYGEFVKIFSRLLPKEVLNVHDGKVEILHKVPESPLDAEDGKVRNIKDARKAEALEGPEFQTPAP